MRFDEWDRAREEFGLSFRRYFKYLSPYAEVRYDRLSEAVDEATLGLDVFPTTDLMLKGEFYHSYPTFDSTSIYSVFAVDKYREYLIRAEYSISAPVTVFASYARQTYEDDDDANRYEVGARFRPMQRLTLNASVDYREGFGGKDWGFEAYGDYRIGEKFLVSAGAQHDTYKRPEDTGDQYAQRYWVGGQWHISKDASLLARVEDNVNENFNHRPLGRVALNWNL
jgi:predicted porin